MSLHNNHFLLPQNSSVQNGENGKKGNPLLKAWGEQLERWCIAAGWPQQTVAYRADVSERTVRDWFAGRAVPRAEKLTNLIVALYDAKQADFAAMGLENNSLTGRPGHIWQQPLDVFDWLALLGLDTVVVLELATNTTIKKWLSTGLTDALPWSHIPLPTMYVEREVDHEMMTALLSRRSYKHPYYRVVVLYGPPGSGKSTLAAAVMRQPTVRNFFRSGGQWLPSEEMKDLLENSHRLLTDGVNDPWDRWWKWLAAETTVGLIVVDDLTSPDVLSELLRRAGSQVQIVVTTQDRDVAQAGLGYLAATEVLYLPVGGFSQAQAESFLSQLWGRPLTEADCYHLGRVLNLLNRPEPLRLLAGEVEAVGWEEVWQWLWEGQDQNTPLGDHWQRLLSKAWTWCKPGERLWLSWLAGAIQHGSTFGSSFATLIWSIKPEMTPQRLILLERRGWLEQVDEIIPASAPHLVILLGNKRYRLLREGWTFIQKQSPITVEFKNKLIWTCQLVLQWQQQLDISWQQLRSSVWKRLKSTRTSLDIEGGYKFVDYRLKRWLEQNWMQRGIWPPEELGLIYEVSFRSRGGLLGLRLVKGLSVTAMAALILIPFGTLSAFLARMGILALTNGGSVLLESIGQAAIVDLPHDLVTGDSPVLPAPGQVQGILPEQLHSKEDDTPPLLIDIN